MPIDKPLAACASCGLRDPSLNYHRHDVSSLPSLFELSKQDMNDLEAIGSVPFIFRCDSHDRPSYFTKEVAISCIISSANINGTLFHLHPELVNFKVNGEAQVQFCEPCSISTKKNQRPEFSIANHGDYGVLSRVKDLGVLSEAEEMLLSRYRQYNNIVKVSKHGIERSQVLRGDFIIFPHSGHVIAKQSLRKRLAWLKAEIQVVLVGPEGSRDSLTKWPELHRVLRMRPDMIYNHLRLRERLDSVLGNQNDSSKLHEPGDTLDADGFLSFSSIAKMCEDTNFAETLIQNAHFLQTQGRQQR